MWGEHDKNWTYERKGDGSTTGTDDETIWENEYKSDGQLSGTADTIKTFKQSFYKHDYTNNEEFIKDKYYDLLFKNEDGNDYLGRDYWLASRYVLLYTNSEYCGFGMQLVNGGVGDSKDCRVNGCGMYWSNRWWLLSLYCASPNSFYRFDNEWI